MQTGRKFRLDRWATLRLSEPLLRLLPVRMRVPILMYHSISRDDEHGIHPYYQTCTTPEIFAQQMGWLHENGFRTISLSSAVQALQKQISLPEKSFVITFDDGYADFYNEAFPILQQYAFTAVMYLPSAFIGEQAREFREKACLSWPQIRELETQGIEFGSHSVTHPQLHELDARKVKYEIFESKQEIEQRLGHAIRSFAYPYAFPEADTSFVKNLRMMLLEAGYSNGVCTIIGSARPRSDQFFLQRLPMNSGDDSQLLAAKFAGAYDWVSLPQYWTKKAKTLGGFRRNGNFKASPSH